MSQMEKQLDSELRAKITEGLQIKDVNGEHVATVDRLEGDQIRVKKSDEMDGKHHYIKLADVRSADDVAVYLNKTHEEIHIKH